MLNLIFINQVPATVRLRRAVIYKTLTKAEKLYGRQLSGKHLAVVFVSPANIKKLNRQYRHKPKPTDVLSFKGAAAGELGDIIICPSIAARAARSRGQSFSDYVNYLFIHGLLHLLGFGHQTSREEKLMAKAEAKLI